AQRPAAWGCAGQVGGIGMATKAAKIKAAKKTPATPPGGAGGEAVVEFLDLAGHELRSPIAVLKGHAQILRRRFAKQPGREADLTELQKMLYQIERLEHELDVYLEAARLMRGRVRLMLERGDLVAVIERLVSLYAQGVSWQAIGFEAKVEALPGEWDHRRVRLLVGALLTNALKYGREHDVVVRLSRASSDRARVEVEDQGIGVLPSERHQIFQPYKTGSN